MIDSSAVPVRRFRIAFFGMLLIWTIGLLIPLPHDDARRLLGNDDNVFTFGKSVHVAAYAVVTLAGMAAFRAIKHRFLLVGLLICHGCLTEFLQGFVGRGPRVADALLDVAGIALGASIAWGPSLRAARPSETS